jgi:hypothetical protein
MTVVPSFQFQKFPVENTMMLVLKLELGTAGACNF